MEMQPSHLAPLKHETLQEFFFIPLLFWTLVDLKEWSKYILSINTLLPIKSE